MTCSDVPLAVSASAEEKTGFEGAEKRLELDFWPSSRNPRGAQPAYRVLSAWARAATARASFQSSGSHSTRHYRRRAPCPVPRPAGRHLHSGQMHHRFRAPRAGFRCLRAVRVFPLHLLHQAGHQDLRDDRTADCRSKDAGAGSARRPRRPPREIHARLLQVSEAPGERELLERVPRAP